MKQSHLSTFIHLDKHLDVVLLRHFMNNVYQGLFLNISNKVIWPPKKFKFHARVKMCHFGIFQKSSNWLDWPCPVSAALQNRPQDLFSLFSTLIFIYFCKYETAWSFGHSDSDPDPSSVCCLEAPNLEQKKQ